VREKYLERLWDFARGDTQGWRAHRLKVLHYCHPDVPGACSFGEGLARCVVDSVIREACHANVIAA
jgi:hypothetical protein